MYQFRNIKPEILKHPEDTIDLWPVPISFRIGCIQVWAIIEGSYKFLSGVLTTCGSYNKTSLKQETSYKFPLYDWNWM